MKYKLNYLEAETRAREPDADFLATAAEAIPAYVARMCLQNDLILAPSDRPGVVENLRILQAHGERVAAALSALRSEAGRR